ncbi:MAG TPA: amidohydrolase family protein [Candidatus Aquilonibacter sp.]|jgi:imidazolonepropionase-like amidohydrolase|nr:amidohydrolase family protein [Candidatus Aquilonibacter sp.]
MRKFLFLFLCSLVVPGIARAQTLSPQVKPFVKIDSPVVALTHVRVIDGTGAPAREDQTIILGQGKIHSVSDAPTASIPKDAQVLDLHGYSVIPGLVGMHDHMFYPTGNGIFGEMGFSFPRLYLAGGVTTIRTTGALEPYTDLEIKKEIDAGAMPGPKIHVTGPYLEGAGSWALQMHQLNGPDDATKTVNFWLDQGVDNFKAYMFITPDELSAAVTAAHKRGAKVTGHLCSIGFRQAADLGIDDLEHGLFVDTEFLPGKKPGVCPEDPENPKLMAQLDVKTGPLHDTILYLVQHHVAVTSTLPVFEMGSFCGRPTLEKRVLDALSPDARSALLWNRLRSSDTATLKQRYGSDISPWPAAYQKELEFEYAFSKAGGLLLAGLDPTGMGGVIAGFGDQREVELLVEAGFTPLEAIHIATANGAQFLGALDRIGTIAPGKQADLVVIKGDPSKKIEDIENVETVFKDGIGYDSAKLIESVRGVVGSR